MLGHSKSQIDSILEPNIYDWIYEKQAWNIYMFPGFVKSMLIKSA